MNRRSCHALGLCQSLAPACPECDYPQTTKKQTNTMKPTILAHNERLLAFIRQHQPISSRALFTSYADAGENASAFAKRLSNLSAQGWLLSSGHANRATWQVDPRGRCFFRHGQSLSSRPSRQASPRPAASTSCKALTTRHRRRSCAPAAKTTRVCRACARANAWPLLLATSLFDLPLTERVPTHEQHRNHPFRLLARR